MASLAGRAPAPAAELGRQSNIDFDYRIIAKPKGYENIRLADKTEVVEGIREHAQQGAAPAKKS